LDKTADRMSCDDLPRTATLGPPNFTQSLYRYMTLAVGVTWRLFGVSWASLSLLLGVLYGATAAVVYALFRLGAPRWPAAVGTALMIASPLQLRYLPQLRDYAKAPFMLALILTLALLVVRPLTRTRLLVLAAAYGAVTGIGFGFRNDLLIALLPFAATVLYSLAPSSGISARQKLAALVLCGAVFATSAWPIIRSYRGGSNTGHVALLGLTSHFDAPLGVTPSIYDWGAVYDDGLAKKIISTYATRV